MSITESEWARVNALKWKIQRSAAKAAKADALETDLATVLSDARAGLTPIPTPGAEWSPTARYTTGDTATMDGVLYTAIKYSRGKSPADNPDCWAPPSAPTYQAWADITDGTVIADGTIVTHGGATWQCTSQHIKSMVYKPKAGSSKWQAYTAQ